MHFGAERVVSKMLIEAINSYIPLQSQKVSITTDLVKVDSLEPLIIIDTEFDVISWIPSEKVTVS